ncbi:hypothetical protein Golob_004149, partial [Gossypium lobatum]|nr:hypothetical protein [Gossypium lobatum]
LISILTENKLNGDNFQEWKRNLLIVLNCEKHKFILDGLLKLSPKREISGDILTRLLDVICKVALARQSVITNLINSLQKPNTLVKEHMVKLMRFFEEVEENGAELEVNTHIEIVFKSLTNEFASFRATYNLGNKAFTLTQLMKELKS